jgi:hypothetical protein
MAQKAMARACTKQVSTHKNSNSVQFTLTLRKVWLAASPEEGTLTMKRTKKVKAVKKTKKQAQTTQPQTRSKTVRVHIAESTRLIGLAGRPTKAPFIKVYGPH